MTYRMQIQGCGTIQLVPSVCAERATRSEISSFPAVKSPEVLESEVGLYYLNAYIQR